MRTKNIVRSAFTDLADIAEARFTEHLENTFERVNVASAVWDIKGYGTIRLAIGRKAGQTTAAIEFANEKYPGSYLYFAPNERMAETCKELGATEVMTWADTSRVNPTGLRAFFVDPGPHAGPKAKEEIYRLAAQALLSAPEGEEEPVIVYFVGT